MSILIIAEHDNKQLKAGVYHTLSAVGMLGGSADMLIIGYNCDSVAQQATRLPGVKTVYVANAAEYQHQLAENCSTLIADMAKQYDYVIAGASTFGKNILPRVAALLDSSMVTDICKIISADTFVRPIYAGNILSTVQTQEKIKILTIRGTAFPAVMPLAESSASIQAVTQVIPNTTSTFESQSLTESTRPELTTARVVISGGRGLKSADNFHLLESIADKLGAAIGASRAAVDAGFAPNDYQVGQTGKIVAPELYIAVGISGAIQHLAGMKDSKVIVAINNDPEAPIFQIADYGLVGDLFKILPELEQELDKVLAA